MRGKYTIDEIRNIVTPIAQQYGVDSLYLFGSYSKGIANEKSDVDVHVDKGKIRTLFALTGFRLALEDALKLPVDLITSDISDKEFLKGIADEEMLLYRKRDYIILLKMIKIKKHFHSMENYQRYQELLRACVRKY